MLTLVSTPIGNLDDLSVRALNALRDADLILAEDTRRTKILLNRFEIRSPLTSYHKFKERESLENILEQLKNGKNIALVSDAGTPCINDPGQILVDACLKEKISVSAIPGPCSLVMALCLSGFSFEKFQFIGFLPKKAKKAILTACYYRGVTVAFESPERLTSTLKIISELAPDREIAVLREMTKAYEECKRGKASDLLAHYEKFSPKGEIVLVLSLGDPPNEPIEDEKLVELIIEEFGISTKEAIKFAAKLQKRSKSELYKEIHKNFRTNS